jgi:hypothetical protein
MYNIWQYLTCSLIPGCGPLNAEWVRLRNWNNISTPTTQRAGYGQISWCAKGGGFLPVIRMCSRLKGLSQPFFMKPKRTLSERSPETATGNRHDVSWTENDLVKEDPGWSNSMFLWGEILSVTHQVPLSKEVLMLPSDCSTLESMLNSLRVCLPGKQWCGWSLYPAHSTPSITTVIHRQWQGYNCLQPFYNFTHRFWSLQLLTTWGTPKSIAS